jgi:hypothetical protein
VAAANLTLSASVLQNCLCTSAEASVKLGTFQIWLSVLSAMLLMILSFCEFTSGVTQAGVGLFPRLGLPPVILD